MLNEHQTLNFVSTSFDEIKSLDRIERKKS